jgi:phosphatidylcholine synthase
MMTDDCWFRGFPAAWNLVVPVMFLMEARTVVGAIITLVMSALSLTNLPFPHVVRAKFLRAVTLAFTAILVGGIVIGTISFPGHPYVARPLLYLGSGYFVVLAIIKMVKDSRDRTAATVGA